MIKLLLLSVFLRIEMPKPCPPNNPNCKKKAELPIDSQYWMAGCLIIGCGLVGYRLKR